jgi:hypothetical protein
MAVEKFIAEEENLVPVIIMLRIRPFFKNEELEPERRNKSY